MQKYSKQKRSYKPWLIAVLVVAIVLIVIGILELTDTTHWLHARKAVSGVIPSTTPNTSAPSQSKSATTTPTPSQNSNDSTSSSNGSSKSSGQQSPSSGTLIDPYGTFVSNHSPNLSGSPAPSSEQSVCQTTPGATCYIRFAMGGIVKTLPTQTANNDGTVIWNWDVNKAGFTKGTWQITAVASLNGTTKNTSDTKALEVSP